MSNTAKTLNGLFQQKNLGHPITGQLGWNMPVKLVHENNFKAFQPWGQEVHAHLDALGGAMYNQEFYKAHAAERAKAWANCGDFKSDHDQHVELHKQMMDKIAKSEGLRATSIDHAANLLEYQKWKKKDDRYSLKLRALDTAKWIATLGGCATALYYFL